MPSEEVFPGVFRITLPLPFELASVNVHLIRLDRGFLLVDCGMDTPESFAALEAGLAGLSIDWADIRQLLLTHIHPDHMGLAAKVIERTHAPLLMHAIEAGHLRLVNTPELRLGWIGRAFLEGGVPEALQRIMHKHFLTIRHNFQPLQPTALLHGGEEIETALGPLSVLHAPGHSPGQVCLYSQKRHLLISGDQILPKITPNISWHPDRDTLDDYLQSLEGLATLEADCILPSHGQTFSGHREWVRATSGHHDERCVELRGALAEPAPGYELVKRLWRKKLSPINQQFALLEVMAHLEYLRRRGFVESEFRDGVAWWRTT